MCGNKNTLPKPQASDHGQTLPVSAETSAGSSAQAMLYRGGGHLGKLGLKDRKKMGMFGDPTGDLETNLVLC